MFTEKDDMTKGEEWRRRRMEHADSWEKFGPPGSGRRGDSVQRGEEYDEKGEQVEEEERNGENSDEEIPSCFSGLRRWSRRINLRLIL